jgi:hypothetical protein
MRKGRAIKSQWGSVYAYVTVHHVSSRGGRTPWVATLTREGAKTWDSGGRIDVMRAIQDYATKHQASVLVMYRNREVARLYPHEWGHDKRRPRHISKRRRTRAHSSYRDRRRRRRGR